MNAYCRSAQIYELSLAKPSFSCMMFWTHLLSGSIQSPWCLDPCIRLKYIYIYGNSVLNWVEYQISHDIEMDHNFNSRLHEISFWNLMNQANSILISIWKTKGGIEIFPVTKRRWECRPGGRKSSRRRKGPDPHRRRCREGPRRACWACAVATCVPTHAIAGKGMREEGASG
jgi:hypothetical protein